MPHKRTGSTFPVALSLDRAVTALDCRRKTLVDAIASKKLKAYRDPTSKRLRVLVRDLERFIMKYWYEV